MEFYNDYFPYPLYRDDDREFFAALGNRSIFSAPTKSYNPLKIWRNIKAIGKRLKGNPTLQGNMKGDGYTAGGLIIFDNNGEPMFIYEEDTGSEFVMDDIKAALEAVRSNAATPIEL